MQESLSKPLALGFMTANMVFSLKLSSLLAAPTSLEGIEKYLASGGLIKGIGLFIKKLIKTFKEDVFQIIEDSPQSLQQVQGIEPFRKQKRLLKVGLTKKSSVIYALPS